MPLGHTAGQGHGRRVSWRQPGRPDRHLDQLRLAGRADPGLEKNGTEPGSVSYRLRPCRPMSRSGVVGVRLITGQGVSNLRLMLLDDLPAIVKAGNNKSLETAQAVTPPIAIDGSCDAESRDFYKFSATAGQRISVEVFARRLGSPLDPTIRLLAADGREIAFSDDEPASGADGRFSHKFESRPEITSSRFATSASRAERILIGCASATSRCPRSPTRWRPPKAARRPSRSPAKASSCPARWQSPCRRKCPPGG